MTLQQMIVRLIDQQEGGTPARIDALIDLLHVASDLAGEVSNESHSFHLDYVDSARTSLDQFEDKKTARQYKKDADVLAKAAHDLSKLRSKLAKKLDR